MATNPHSLLAEAKIKKLKPTATVVRFKNGKVRVERQELLSQPEKEKRVADSVLAGKLRKGLKEQQAKQILASEQYPIPSGQTSEYNNELDSWVPVSPSADVFIVLDSIRVVSFNVWFSKFQWETRLEALLDLVVEREYADVVCLQEVTPHFLEKMLQYTAVRERYRLAGAFKTWYGVCMLVAKHLPPPNILVLPIPTRMGRFALIANIGSSAGASLAIATVHLESLNSKSTRSDQLDCINQALEKFDSALLVGDFNITATGPWANENEHQEVLNSRIPGYVDLWSREHGTDADQERTAAFSQGVTFDSVRNGMLGSFAKFQERSRYDRAYMKESSWHGLDVSVIGEQQITKTLATSGARPRPVFISDHFGLVMKVVHDG